MSHRNLPVTRIPSGVTEVEYRRAIQQNRKQSAATATVDSAALQSEMARKYNLSTTRVRPSQSTARKVSSLAQSGRRTPAVIAPSPIICACCNSANSSNDQICSECGYFLNSIVTVPETLAQRRGLLPVAPPQAPLTPFDWAVIENSRADPDSCCPICMEGFKQGHEVLLSCSHIFHRACLRSFENFMKDSEFACPICRTKNYQKKITHIGSWAFQKVCALKLQRLYRGYCARKLFRTRLRVYYRSTAAHATSGSSNGQAGLAIDDSQRQRRKQYYESEITSISNKLDQNLNRRGHQVDSMLRSMDRTIEESQQLDVLFEQMLAARLHGQTQSSITTGPGAASSSGGNLPPPLALPSHVPDDDAIDLDLGFADDCAEFCHEAQQDWSDIYNAALKRFPCDCAICMLPVGGPAVATTSRIASDAECEQGGGMQKYRSGHSKREIILSCSHVFHAKCIGNFERFLLATKTRMCPVCRSVYSKKIFRIKN